MRKPAFIFLLALASLASGCTLLVDGEVGGITLNEKPDMNLHLVGMDPHLNQLTEIYLVNGNSLVQAVAIYDGLPEVDVDVQLANVVDTDVRRVDFYCDLHENHQLDSPVPDSVDPSRLIFPDHMWRLTLDENGEASFTHNTNFTDITETDPVTGTRPSAKFVGSGPLTLTVTGVGDFTDQPATVSVWGPDDRQVGFYFLQTITGDTMTIDFMGRQFVDEGTSYILEIELGSDPEAQPLCISGTATDSGLSVEAALPDLLPCQ